MKFKLSKKFLLVIIAATSIPFLGFIPAHSKAAPTVATAVVTNNEAAQADGLLQLLNQRLELSEDLAHWKWHHTRPIDCDENDKALIDNFIKECKEQGIDSDFARRMIESQIEAGKILEVEHFQNHLNKDEDVKAFDQDGYATIEKKIMNIDTKIAESLKEVLPQLQKPDFNELLKEKADAILGAADKSASAKALAISPLVNG